MIDLLVTLAPRPVIAIMRAARPDHLLDAATRLVAGGITTLEITLTTPGALNAIEAVRASHPDAVVGAGTVRTPELAHRAVDAGAEFLVSQLLNPDVIDVARAAGVPMVPGCLTPNEIATAWDHDVQAVKISPIAPVGGAAYLREVRAPMPDVPLIVTGGIEPDQLETYLAAGATAVGLSARLFGDCLDSGDTSMLESRARALVRRLQQLDHPRAGHPTLLRTETSA